MYYQNAEVRKKKLYRRLGWLCALALALVGVASSQLIGSNNLPILKIVNQAKVPLDGLAGLGFYSSSSGQKIFLVGAKKAESMSFTYSPSLFDDAAAIETPRTYEFGQAVIDYFGLCPTELGRKCKEIRKILTSDWQALAVDGVGRNFVLQEGSSTLVVFDAEWESVQNTMRLNFDPLASTEAGYDESVLGEGLLLMRSGHLLVAKAKKPTLLVEFGPAGDLPLGVNSDTLLADDEPFLLPEGSATAVMVPLKIWRPAGGRSRCDLSDLAKDQLGRIYILSQGCASITMIDNLLENSEEFKSSAAWQLPKTIKKAQGLAVVGDKMFVVGADLDKHKSNLFFLESRD